MADKSPSILVFFSDQQRWDTVGCYGQRLPVTPNLDAMAADGVRFDYAFTPQPVCGPARACLQTGRYATEVGVHKNDADFKPGGPTVPEHLSGAGYEAGYLGKWHLAKTGTAPIPPELRFGYTDFWLAADLLEYTSHGYEGGYMYDDDMQRVDFPGYRVDSETDFVLDYLRTRDGQRPWFLFLSYLEPHHQNDRNRYEGPEGSKERFKDYDVPGDLVDTDGDWRENYPDYLGQCNSLDQNLGRIRQELAHLGMAENTIIIYTSDHGSHFRTRNSEYKRSCQDDCLHVPMIIHGPGFRGGKVSDEMVSLIDVPPTILTAAGVEPPAAMHGRPLQGLADGTATDWPQQVFVQISEDHLGRAVRTKRWTYEVSFPILPAEVGALEPPSSEIYYEAYLYDNQVDPHQRTNLVADSAYAAVRTELAALLIKMMVEAGEAAPLILPTPTKGSE